MTEKEETKVTKKAIIKDELKFDNFVSIVPSASRYSFFIWASATKKELLAKKMSKDEWQKVFDNDYLKQKI